MPSQPLFLPEQVVSQVLSSYCDGRSISCFFNVLRGSRDLCPLSFNKIIKDALVHRYKSLAKSCEESALADKLLEVYCVVDMVREEIRTSSESSVGNGRFSHGNGNAVSIVDASRFKHVSNPAGVKVRLLEAVSVISTDNKVQIAMLQTDLE